MIISFNSSATSITAGQSVTITWETANATAVRLNGLPVATTGSKSFTPNSNQTYGLAVDGAATTITGSLSVTVVPVVAPPPPPPPPMGDFATRAAGSVRAWDFSQGIGQNVTGAITGAYPNVGWFPGSSNNPSLDTSLGLNAVRFDVPSQSGSNAGGEWYINFSPDLLTQFDGGSEFFMQWRQRFNDAMMDQYITGGAPYLHSSGLTFADPTAIKQVIISSQDQLGVTFQSCTELELVATSYLQRRFPFLYQACGFADPLIDKDPLNGNDFRLQNAMPAPYCTMLGSADYNTPSVPAACAGWFRNEWMTFQVGVKLGPRDNTLDRFVGSRVRMWVAREGKPSQLVIDIIYDIHSGPGGPGLANQKYGKAWFGPYMTNKDATIVHPTMTTWVAEFIVSRSPILDPIVLTLPPQGIDPTPVPPPAPVPPPIIPSPTPGPLSTIVSGTVRNMGSFSDGSIAQVARTDYSSIIYESGDKQMLLFGGGHGPGIYTDIRSYPLSTLPSPWVSLYASTPLTDMLNADGSYPKTANIDLPFGRWSTTNQPVTRHTFNMSLMIGRKYYTMVAYASTDGSGTGTGRICWYDLDANTWSYSQVQTAGWYYVSGAALDPTSGKVLIYGTDNGATDWIHLYLYDPVADTVTFVKDTGNAGAYFDLHYIASLDKFIALEPGGLVSEITFNRTTPSASTVAFHVATTGTPPPNTSEANKTAWDGSKLSGYVVAGIAYAYDPTTHIWTSQQLKNEDGTNASMNQTYYCLGYDPDSGCHIFIGSGGNTYAYRQ